MARATCGDATLTCAVLAMRSAATANASSPACTLHRRPSSRSSSESSPDDDMIATREARGEPERVSARAERRPGEARRERDRGRGRARSGAGDERAARDVRARVSRALRDPPRGTTARRGGARVDGMCAGNSRAKSRHTRDDDRAPITGRARCDPPARDHPVDSGSTGSAPGGVPPARVKFVVLARVGFSFRRARRPNAPSTVSHFSTLSYLHLLTYAPLSTPIYAPRPPPTRVIPPPAPPRRPGTARTRSP